MGRNTATRDQHRKVIAYTQPPCHLCKQPIDYDLPHLHPLSFVVDHVIPINRGGQDVLANKAAAHRSCNRTKSDKLEPVVVVTVAPLETTRTW